MTDPLGRVSWLVRPGLSVDPGVLLFQELWEVGVYSPDAHSTHVCWWGPTNTTGCWLFTGPGGRGHPALTLGCLHFWSLHLFGGPSVYIPASLAGRQGTPSPLFFQHPGQTACTGKGSRLALSGSLPTTPPPPPGEVLGPWQPRQHAPKTCFITSVATRQPASNAPQAPGLLAWKTRNLFRLTA